MSLGRLYSRTLEDVRYNREMIVSMPFSQPWEVVERPVTVLRGQWGVLKPALHRSCNHHLCWNKEGERILIIRLYKFVLVLS